MHGAVLFPASALQDPSAGGAVRFGFELAGLHLVPAQGVLTELVAQAQVFPVPCAADTLAGVINVHGTIVPVVDPARAGHPSADLRPGPRRALVFGRDEQRVGVLLDAAPALLNLVPGAAGAPRPPGVLARFLTRAWCEAEHPQRVWWEFDHSAAFESLAGPDTALPTEPSRPSTTEVTP